MRKVLLIALAVAALGLIPALALANAKQGIYASNSGVLVTVNHKLKVTGISATCNIEGSGGASENFTGSLKVKHNKFGGKGKAAVGLSTTKVKASASGSFFKQGKRVKGTLKVVGCDKVKFRAKYLGKHPQG